MGKKRRLLLFFACLMLLILAERHVLGNPELFRRNVLYGSYSYARESYRWIDRAILLGIGFAWINVLFFVVPEKKIPIISMIGRNTLPIFLFHGFFVRLMLKMELFCYSEMQNLVLALILSVLILLMFGNPGSAWICKWFFTGHWLAQLTKKRVKR